MAKGKILIAKPGLDGHDRGAMIIAHALRDAGFEVIYTGIRQTPEQIAAAAVEEDVDIIGLSCLSGAHLELFGRVTELLRQKGLGDTPVICGGIIPEGDIPRLREMGIKKVFTPGASTTEIVDYFNNLLGEN